MSAKEIIQELPKLTDADRRAIREKLIELAAQNEDIEVCNQAALQGAFMLDRLENEDAQRAPRSRLGYRFRLGGKGSTGPFAH